MGPGNAARGLPACLTGLQRKTGTMVTASTVQRARQQIADRLREIRLDAD